MAVCRGKINSIGRGDKRIFFEKLVTFGQRHHPVIDTARRNED